jgi:hypothetical protein
MAVAWDGLDSIHVVFQTDSALRIGRRLVPRRPGHPFPRQG